MRAEAREDEKRQKKQKKEIDKKAAAEHAVAAGMTPAQVKVAKQLQRQLDLNKRAATSAEDAGQALDTPTRIHREAAPAPAVPRA